MNEQQESTTTPRTRDQGRLGITEPRTKAGSVPQDLQPQRRYRCCRDATADKGRKKYHGLSLPPAFQSPISTFHWPSSAETLLMWEPGDHGLQREGKGWIWGQIGPEWPRNLTQFLFHLRAQKCEDRVSLSLISRRKWAYVFETATKMMMTDGGTRQQILKVLSHLCHLPYHSLYNGGVGEEGSSCMHISRHNGKWQGQEHDHSHPLGFMKLPNQNCPKLSPFQNYRKLERHTHNERVHQQDSDSSDAGF